MSGNENELPGSVTRLDSCHAVFIIIFQASGLRVHEWVTKPFNSEPPAVRLLQPSNARLSQAFKIALGSKFAVFGWHFHKREPIVTTLGAHKLCRERHVWTNFQRDRCGTTVDKTSKANRFLWNA